MNLNKRMRFKLMWKRVYGNTHTTCRREGAENFAVIRSYLDTMRKQGHRMHDILRSVFSGQILQPASG